MKTENHAKFRTAPLAPEFIPFLEALEDATGLQFWGGDSYRRCFEDFSEYFGFCLVPEAGNKGLAGFSLARAVLEEMELLKIGISPEFQRSGSGSLLLEKTFAEGKRRGCKRCFLEVRKSNWNAVQFYLACGFRVTGDRRNYYSNPAEDARIMERLLT